MARRHINEFRKTEFVHSGSRAAGMGILYDDYSEDSGLPRHGPSSGLILGKHEKDKPELNSPVITYKLTDEELKKYRGEP